MAGCWRLGELRQGGEMKYMSLRVMVIPAIVFSTANAAVWYVHPDSTMNCIQHALDSCSTGDTVLVGPGTYYENLVWPCTQGMKLIGELGPESTTIDGSQTNSVLTCTTSVDSTTTIRGFTIQHGNDYFGGGICCINSSPTISDNCIKENSYGGGIRCHGSSATIITNNEIINNTGSDCGGICCHDSSSPIISNNLIADNLSGYNGGIGCWGNSTPIITNNIIAKNSANEIFPVRGGGIYCDDGSSPIITYNTISDNYVSGSGGGICCYSGVGVEIIGNTISGNYSWGVGGGISCFGVTSCVIRDNVISDNDVPQGMFSPGLGGGIFIEQSSLSLIDNIITMNWAGGHGGGIYAEHASPLVDSCSVTYNDGDGIYCTNSSEPILRNCAIAANIGFGIYNADSNTMVDAENNWWGDPSGPYHPILNPGGLGNAVSDYVGFDPWFIGPGIHEYANSITPVTNLQVYPNPFTKLTTIGYSIPNGLDSRQKIEVSMKIYDATGRLAKSLYPVSPPSPCVAGQASIQNQESVLVWDGTDQSNRDLPSGVYLIRLSAGGHEEAKKVLLVR